jgi:hypothetical protein
MKRGGEEIYVGPVGQNSSRLIEYFEVRREVKDGCYNCLLEKPKMKTLLSYLFRESKALATSRMGTTRPRGCWK